jgi:hypothetical protein
MKELFVSYKLAKVLKEKGFDEECIAYQNKDGTPQVGSILEVYNVILTRNGNKNYDTIPVPLYQQVIDWFREKHKINIIDNYYPNTKEWGFSVYSLDLTGVELIAHLRKENHSLKYNSSRKAVIAGIEHALKLI